MKTRKMKRRLRVNPEEAFPTVEKLLYKMAWSTTKRYGVPFDETRSEVSYAFMKACWRFDPKRATFLSLCGFLANCRLRRLIMERASATPMEEINDELVGMAPPQRSECLDMLEDLSEDAREIIALLLETPQELLEEAPTPKQLLRRVKVYLVETGKDKRRLDKAQKEIQFKFRKVWATI